MLGRKRITCAFCILFIFYQLLLCCWFAFISLRRSHVKHTTQSVTFMHIACTYVTWSAILHSMDDFRCIVGDCVGFSWEGGYLVDFFYPSVRPSVNLDYWSNWFLIWRSGWNYWGKVLACYSDQQPSRSGQWLLE